MRCVILDDYQGVAPGLADWTSLQADVDAVTEHLEDDVLVARLAGAEVVVTGGMRNASIDLAACADRGVTVCGTASSSTPPLEVTWALGLGLVRRVVPEATSLREGGAVHARRRPGEDVAARRAGEPVRVLG